MSKYGLPGFDGREPDFAVGSVAGVRWWRLLTGAEGGRLSGVRASWAPGENIAKCGRGMTAGTHVVPDENCGCGFWAYWSPPGPDNEHGFKLAVLGVVEGYGKTLIGERGFRCAKARITALHVPAFTVTVTEDRAGDWDVPKNIRQRGGGAIATWRAITGRTERQLDPAEVLAMHCELEMRLEEDYGVPVYATAGLMLRKHPPTPDYLPQGGQPLSLPSKPVLTVAEARAILAAKAMPATKVNQSSEE